ncbi:unnamed protein product [Withania somnifera]
MERYEIVKELGSGNFGVAKLVCDKKTKEFFAVKFIERGQKIDEHVQREIMNHRSLKHPNIVRFKEVLLTPTHLAIVMEYAAGGELFARICKAGRFNEDEARFFFQQLISGVSYCHFMSSIFHSQPKSTVGTPAYVAPEVLTRKEYDGKLADVWSCGVTLYIMLVGAYPFQDPSDAKNFTKTIAKILSVCYSIPEQVKISLECHHLLNRIFVADPEKRITIPEIKMHPWFLKNLPVELMEGGSYQCVDVNNPSQSMEEVLAIIQEARVPLLVPKSGTYSYGGSMELDELDEADVEDVTEISGDFAGLL